MDSRMLIAMDHELPGPECHTRTRNARLDTGENSGVSYADTRHRMTLSPLLNALRAATHEIHQDLEGRLIIAAPDAGPDQYRRYLEAFWGWLSPFEAALWSAPWPPSLRPDLRDGKRRWIEDDLRAL